MVAEWVRLERWTGDRVVLSSNPAAATSIRNFGNSVYPALQGLRLSQFEIAIREEPREY